MELLRVAVFLGLCLGACCCQAVVLSDSAGLGRGFDGIGGLSGGGPNFGASLHILKMERSRHTCTMRMMRTTSEGLPWAFPGWVGHGKSWPYDFPDITAAYVIWNERNFDSKYIKVLRNTLDKVGLTGVGIIAADGNWSIADSLNADPHLSECVEVVGITVCVPLPLAEQLLRYTLDKSGLEGVRIIASDNLWQPITLSLLQDPELGGAVDVIGAHYPGTTTVKEALQTQKKLWSSEDYSSVNDEVGGAAGPASSTRTTLGQTALSSCVQLCVDDCLLQHHLLEPGVQLLRGSAVRPGRADDGRGAVERALRAHTTQFTQPGWSYLQTVGHLAQGGTYVALTDGRGSLTVTSTPPFNVTSQNATFQLKGSFVSSAEIFTTLLQSCYNAFVLFSMIYFLQASITELQVWRSQFNFKTKKPSFFQKLTPLTLVDGSFTLSVAEDEVYTLTTVTSGQKGSYPGSPPLLASPNNTRTTLMFKNLLHLCVRPLLGNPPFSEAPNFADQTGVFEYYLNLTDPGAHSFTLRQVLTERPITWAADADQTISVIGDHQWQNVTVSCDVFMESVKTGGVFIAARVDKGGQSVRSAQGVFFWVFVDGTYKVTNDLAGQTVLAEGQSGTRAYGWHTLTLTGQHASGLLNGYPLWKNAVVLAPPNGWAALGTHSFELAQFDNFAVLAE
ncbi:hypothetical protein F7725_007497 [Dissostichus mawsoni]|uniref:Galactocerebrosidase n=1 Tax=Dissostichus mawsoni TaxID=36200 RepID=A0A7J5Y4J7_DISMA|nr:hypothetical protein F7725_007497 [Dissostichus mawsoni]